MSSKKEGIEKEKRTKTKSENQKDFFRNRIFRIKKIPKIEFKKLTGWYLISYSKTAR